MKKRLFSVLLALVAVCALASGALAATSGDVTLVWQELEGVRATVTSGEISTHRLSKFDWEVASGSLTINMGAIVSTDVISGDGSNSSITSESISASGDSVLVGTVVVTIPTNGFSLTPTSKDVDSVVSIDAYDSKWSKLADTTKITTASADVYYLGVVYGDAGKLKTYTVKISADVAAATVGKFKLIVKNDDTEYDISVDSATGYDSDKALGGDAFDYATSLSAGTYGFSIDTDTEYSVSSVWYKATSASDSASDSAASAADDIMAFWNMYLGDDSVDSSTSSSWTKAEADDSELYELAAGNTYRVLVAKATTYFPVQFDVASSDIIDSVDSIDSTAEEVVDLSDSEIAPAAVDLDSAMQATASAALEAAGVYDTEVNFLTDAAEVNSALGTFEDSFAADSDPMTARRTAYASTFSSILNSTSNKFGKKMKTSTMVPLLPMKPTVSGPTGWGASSKLKTSLNGKRLYYFIFKVLDAASTGDVELADATETPSALLVGSAIYDPDSAAYSSSQELTFTADLEAGATYNQLIAEADSTADSSSDSTADSSSDSTADSQTGPFSGKGSSSGCDMGLGGVALLLAALLPLRKVRK